MYLSRAEYLFLPFFSFRRLGITFFRLSFSFPLSRQIFAYIPYQPRSENCGSPRIWNFLATQLPLVTKNFLHQNPRGGSILYSHILYRLFFLLFSFFFLLFWTVLGGKETIETLETALVSRAHLHISKHTIFSRRRAISILVLVFFFFSTRFWFPLSPFSLIK